MMENDEKIIAQLIGHLDEAIAICNEIAAKCNKSCDDNAETEE